VSPACGCYLAIFFFSGRAAIGGCQIVVYSALHRMAHRAAGNQTNEVVCHAGCDKPCLSLTQSFYVVRTWCPRLDTRSICKILCPRTFYFWPASLAVLYVGECAAVARTEKAEMKAGIFWLTVFHSLLAFRVSQVHRFHFYRRVNCWCTTAPRLYGTRVLLAVVDYKKNI